MPDLRRNISTDCWQRTKHPDSTRPAQSFHTSLYIHKHTDKLHWFTHLTRGAWLKTKHLDRLLITDGISRQHTTRLLRLSLTTAHTYKTWGTPADVLKTPHQAHTHTFTEFKYRSYIMAHKIPHPHTNCFIYTQTIILRSYSTRWSGLINSDTGTYLFLEQELPDYLV